MPHDVLIQLDAHDAVLFQSMQGTGLFFAGFEPAQGLRHGHLVDHDLILAQGLLGDAVTGLDDAGFSGVGGRGHGRGTFEETADGNGIGRIVRALVDDLEHVVPADDAGRDLDAARPPAVGHGHLSAGKRHLVAGDGHCLEQGPAHHAFGAFIKIGKVVAFQPGGRRRGRQVLRHVWPPHVFRTRQQPALPRAYVPAAGGSGKVPPESPHSAAV